MDHGTSIQRVRRVLSRVQGAPIATGELVLDLGFARELLLWKDDGPKVEALDPVDLLIECCRILKLDLVCLQADQVIGPQSETTLGLEGIHRFEDSGLFVFWIVNGAFQSAVHRHGLMSVFSRIAQSPDALAAECMTTSDRVMAAMEQGVQAGVHGVIIADDIAYNHGTYMSPEFIEQCLQPAWKLQTEKANQLDVPVFFHSDGNLNRVLSHIIAAGFDGLQCIEPAAGMDIVEISAQYGKALCLMGGIDPRLLLIHNDNRCDMESALGNLQREIKRLMAPLSTGGGIILGSSSGLYAGMSPVLVYAMYQMISELVQGNPNK